MTSCYSPACVELVKISESKANKAYRDEDGVWTIGYGHTGPHVVDGLEWTDEQVDGQLVADLGTAFRQMCKLVKVELTQGQIDALTDFVFNLGSGQLQESMLLRLLNLGRHIQVPAQLYREDQETGEEHGFIFGKGRILPGLVTRRKAEIELWNQPGESVSLAA